MPFQYTIVLSPWAQECLYRRALESGEPNVKKYLVTLWLDAVEKPEIVERAIQIAEKQANQKHGPARSRAHGRKRRR